MSRLEVDLEPATAAFVEAEVSSGRYVSPEAVIKTALELLQQTEASEEDKDILFWKLVDEGRDADAGGDLTEVDDVDAWLVGLRRAPKGD